MNSIEKNRLKLFFAVAYGMTLIMWIFMYIGRGMGKDLTSFVNVQMTYPACGVILGFLLFKEEGKKIPKAGFIVFLITAAVMVVISLLSIALPETMVESNGNQISNWNLVSQLVLVGGSTVAYILFWVCGREKRANVGLGRVNVKLSALMVLLFIVLYFVRCYIALFLEQRFINPETDSIGQLNAAFVTVQFWYAAVVTLINFPFSMIAFLGEEYGWRYYLQPIMQKKYGLRLGVVLLGILWAVWHTGVDFMFYSQTSGLQVFIGQIFTCLSLAFFWGFVYMKTQNIWAIAMMHFINNNYIVLLSGGDVSVISSQNITWTELGIIAVESLVFAIFILAPAYRKKKQQEA